LPKTIEVQPTTYDDPNLGDLADLLYSEFSFKDEEVELPQTTTLAAQAYPA